jgi:hypothetical protein
MSANRSRAHRRLDRLRGRGVPLPRAGLGEIAGASHGMLKLLVSTDDLKLLGVHIVGTNATELVHIGQAVMGGGGTIEYLVDAVFNAKCHRRRTRQCSPSIRPICRQCSPGVYKCPRRQGYAMSGSHGA